MMELGDLYQEIILDHKRSPRNFGRLESPDRTAIGHNPLCGDKLVVDLALDGDRIREVRFKGEGCAISTASASLMTEALAGRTVEEAEALIDRMHRLLTEDGAADAEDLGKLVALQGVKQFPARVKCATLAWNTARAALRGDPDRIVTTE